MPFICYVPKRFQGKSEDHISKATEILEEYQELGLDLTLRQLYYQFVSRDFIPNSFKEYKKLQKLISDARLAGRIDWNSIEDRTRNLQSWPWSSSPESAIRKTATGYNENKWNDQPVHVEVWVEKDALLGVIEKACLKYQTPFFSCRGYTSQSEVWNSAMRLKDLEAEDADDYGQTKKPVVILHLGDHDPSGVDMSRDIQDRMTLFEADNVTVDRIALTMEQIRERRPPPNPAKLTDSRAKGYIREHGPKSWELDALDPTYLIELIQRETERHVDLARWEAAVAKEKKGRDGLYSLSNHFDVATRFVANDRAREEFLDDERDGKFEES